MPSPRNAVLCRTPHTNCVPHRQRSARSARDAAWRRAGGETQERFRQLEQGIQRAQRLVDQLLRLSRQEAVTGDAAPTEVDVIGRPCCARTSMA